LLLCSGSIAKVPWLRSIRAAPSRSCPHATELSVRFSGVLAQLTQELADAGKKSAPPSQRGLEATELDA
jgi:hypothetical protein